MSIQHTHATVRWHDVEIADVPVAVEFTYRPGDRPVIFAPAEDCHPGSPDEFEIVSVKTDEAVAVENSMQLLGEGVEILDLLDDDELARLESLLEAPEPEYDF